MIKRKYTKMNIFLINLGAIIEALVRVAVILIGLTICLFLFTSIFGVSQPLSGIMGGILFVVAIVISAVLGRREYYRNYGIDPVTKKKL